MKYHYFCLKINDMGDRHQFRARWHDYNGGVYFITICCADKKHLFGEIRDNELVFTECGHIAEGILKAIPKHFLQTEVWNYVIMPNHIHLLIWVEKSIDNDSIDNHGCIGVRKHIDNMYSDCHHNSRLAKIIGQFKSSVTRECRRVNPAFAWQSRFYDNIITQHWEYVMVMNYIDNNVDRWENDCFNPDKKMPTKFY